jgi:hypothetical protein
MRSLMADTIAYSDRPRGLELGSFDEFLGWLKELTTGMSDARVNDPDYLEAGEYSVCRFNGRGTNDGPMGPAQATTGKRMDMPFCEILRVQNGRVTSGEIFYDRLTMLGQLGLLHYRENKGSVLSRFASKFLGLVYSLLRSSLPPRQKGWLADLFPALRKKAELTYTSFASIDWTRTKAYCSEVLAAPPSIWINLEGVKLSGIVGPTEYPELIEFIIKKVRELKDPRTGQPVVARVYRREDLFHGPFAAEGADLIIDWWNEDSLHGTEPSFAEERDDPPLVIREHRSSGKSEWGGTHRLHGILVGAGPALKKNVEIENAHLIDLAPTLLHLFGVAVPEDMDGSVLVDAFRPEFLAEHPVKAGAASGTSGGDRSSGYTDEESAKVEERLKALGYLE